MHKDFNEIFTKFLNTLEERTAQQQYQIKQLNDYIRSLELILYMVIPAMAHHDDKLKILFTEILNTYDKYKGEADNTFLDSVVQQLLKYINRQGKGKTIDPPRWVPEIIRGGKVDP